jgi:hypothetical protein
MLSLIMASSPAWRFNAKRFEVHHPGDYATLNSNQPRDRTDHRGGGRQGFTDLLRSNK